MDQQLLFFFSALGAFNGIIVGFYFLFFSKPKHLSNIFLGCLFLALSVRVGKSVFFYFYDTIADAYIQFGLFACWLIGPFLFFYIKSTIQVSSTLKKQAVSTLVSLGIVSFIINFLFPWSDHPKLWSYFVRGIYLQWLFFVILSGYVIFKNHQLIFKQSKNKPFKIWLSSIFLGNFIICLAFNTGNYTSYIVGALSFSFVFYALILLLLFYKRRDELLFLQIKKYQSNQINSEEVEKLSQHLEQLLLEDSLFLDANLTLQKVATLLKVSSVKISQILNQHLNTNFNDYINSFRIQAAKEKIVNGSDLTLEAIGLDCGFNSKSTFYNAFKKQTGTTPSKFREENKKV
ncbi:helix-turn-helix domain-containing protein [Aquimarina litoralis]|uniref:helix-turn-helix domain-containing protein n=1 Tax=Aquimarina litoralis TaxID=584605 RepID=UPI001C58D880|nr:helix-turn-helix domain-containing protein [Aquimarina litoralis]MBW1296630.1 helix-turn-helix domain-containing protein [Aquimarina litoralis]